MDYNGNKIVKFSILCFVGMLVGACSTNNNSYAPVVNGIYQTNNSGYYTVKSGDTLYSIAWGFGLDYRDLAASNNISPPYTLYVGQSLRVKAIPGWQMPNSYAATAANPAASQATPVVQNTPVNQTPAITATPVVVKNTGQKSAVIPYTSVTVSKTPVGQWSWPANGRVIQTFDPTDGFKGIDIAGKMGSPIDATAAGQVVYSGSGLAGYGNLIIIKHNDDYLSAYANNKMILVHEGQVVTAGQEIATMGNTGTDRVKLHFEIRKAGQPVDPMKYLPKPND